MNSRARIIWYRTRKPFIKYTYCITVHAYKFHKHPTTMLLALAGRTHKRCRWCNRLIGKGTHGKHASTSAGRSVPSSRV